MPVWPPQGLCSAEPLVTASAAPHWPFRLTDDAPQAARACLAEQGFAFAGPLVISGQKHDTRDDSLATSLNMVAKCFTADAPLASCSMEAKCVTGTLYWSSGSVRSAETPHRRCSTVCCKRKRSALQATLYWPTGQHVAAKRLTGDAPLASCSVDSNRVTGDALLATRLPATLPGSTCSGENASTGGSRLSGPAGPLALQGR